MEGRKGSVLQRAREGDMEAFAALFEPLRSKVYAIGYRLLGPNDAEDLVMDTFLRAWKGLPRFKGYASLNTWVCRIARNIATDVLRRRRTQRAHLVDEESLGTPLADTPDVVQSPADVIVGDREMAGHVARALSELSEPHRQVLLLRHSDGLKYSEIAAALGISMGTVMSRLFNARKRLHEIVSRLTGNGDSDR
jgi:RNA polymerase sigma-70 factor (ECF subfamily)